ncbi:hypothetical protein BDZ94DRAFT_1263246 [Collybia nuda]|uniref:Uncharacterized protein n=1 Tax=Collybia nuda TaxID=64659 RepID=A0A9P5Y510_9AGAR|nr:hypothetical protein BDZ94DRAFT_1263246 [Collybia nuda]
MALPPLRYRPIFITNLVLFSYVIATILCIAPLIIWLIRLNDGPFTGPSIFFDGLIPGYIATILRFVAVKQVGAFTQTMPFCIMASGKVQHRHAFRTILTTHIPFESTIPSFGSPKQLDELLELLNAPTVFVIEILAGNLFRRQYIRNGDSYGLEGWEMNVGVCIGVIACLVTLDIIASTIMVFLFRRSTGLAEEPGSIATLVGMARGAKHIWEDFHGLDIERYPWKVRRRLSSMKYHISPDYTLSKYVLDKEAESTLEKVAPEDEDTASITSPPCANPRPARFDYVPWFVRSPFLSIWSAALFGGFVAALSLGLRGSRDDGFDPLVPTAPLPYLGLSCADILWSFFPAYVAVFYRQILGNIDKFYRVVQPYADLHYGNAGFHILGMNYSADLFPFITINAIRNKHWRVALSSFLSFTSSLLPIFATSMFYVGYPDGSTEKRLLIYQPVFNLAVATMALLSLTFLALVPTRLYFMPHPLETFADHLSLLYNSSLLQETAFTFVPEIKPFSWPWAAKPSLSRKMEEFRDRNTEGFSMGIRKACITENNCGGPHGICIDASQKVNAYYVEEDRDPEAHWKEIKHIISSF